MSSRSPLFAIVSLLLVPTVGCSRSPARPDAGGGSGGIAIDAGGGAGGAGGDARADGPAGDVEPEVPSATGSVSASDVAVDGTGNIVMVGTLDGTVDIGNGALTSAGGGDLLVAAFTAARAVVWSRRFGDAQAQGGGAIAIDASGNVVVAAGFNGGIDFGGGLLTSAGGTDIAVAKLDGTGRHLWSRRFGVAGEQGDARVALAPGGIVVSGTSGTSFDFGGGGPDAGLRTVSSLALLDPSSGDVIWSKAWAGVSIRSSIVNRAGEIVVGGSFTDAVDFGGGALANAGHTDMFLAAFGGNGDLLWSKGFGDGGSQDLVSLAVDATDNLLVTGSFDGTLAFGAPPLVVIVPPNRTAPTRDVFVAKLDRSGNHIWSRRLGEPQEPQWGVAVGADGVGSVFVTGGFAVSIDLGNGPLAAAAGAAFLLKMDAVGASVWSQQLAAAPVRIRPEPSGRLLLAGSFPASASFPSATATFVGGSRIFLVEYAP